MTHAELIAALDALPVVERLSLAEHLLAGIDAPGHDRIEDNLTVVRRRLDAYAAGRAEAVDMDTALSEFGVRL